MSEDFSCTELLKVTLGTGATQGLVLVQNIIKTKPDYLNFLIKNLYWTTTYALFLTLLLYTTFD